MKKTYAKLGLILAMTAGAPIAANSATLYNNLPATLVDADGGLASLTSAGYSANKFSTNSVNCPILCQVGSISIALNSVLSPNLPNPYKDGYKLEIFNSVLGVSDQQNPIDVPGTTLIGTLNNPSLFPSSANIYQFTASSPINLTTNTNYWVKLSPTSSVRNTIFEKEQMNWYALHHDFYSQEIAGQPNESLWVGLGGGNPAFLQDPAGFNLLMKVETPTAGDPVPVPGAVWLMGSALLGLIRTWRKK